MITQTMNRIKNLKKEIELLRSLVIGVVGRDSEGRYRPEFIERIHHAVDEKYSHRFTSRKSFLKLLSR